MKKLFVPVLMLSLAVGCSKTNQQNNLQVPVDNTSTKVQNSPPQMPPLPSLPVYSGTLRVSDNLDKGNLMLVALIDSRSYGEITKETKIYIKTDRDFSKFIGKKVLVDFIGNKDGFNFVDMVEDDGQPNKAPFGN